MDDYQNRRYLSAIEAAKYLGLTVRQLHGLAKVGSVGAVLSPSGQKRFKLGDLRHYEDLSFKDGHSKEELVRTPLDEIAINNTFQRMYTKSSTVMDDLSDNSIHLMITSPPYFNAKMYSRTPRRDDLGDIHDLDEWFKAIGRVWKEVFRVLQPGRKAFINIMNLPVRENGGFKTLNLTGRTIDLMEKLGFIFKRDIIWHKTNGVRAQFGTYPYPGGILINNMHEFILEFNKPEKKGLSKYFHLTRRQKEESKIDKEFWLSIKNSDVWLIKPQNSGDGRTHVAPFPYELPYRLIKAFSYIGETVLDPFLGSGTTLKVAADLGRNGVGYELIPEIAEDAIRNLRSYQEKLF